MNDLREQLAYLRRKVQQINQKFAAPSVSEPRPPSAPHSVEDYFPLRYFTDEYMSGEVVETPCGTHFETEKLYPRQRRHGIMDLSNLHELPDDLLQPLLEGFTRKVPPARWAFLDTETTGLATGPGTYAFLIGVGRICQDGFRVRQFFMRDFSEEPSLLHALNEHLADFEILITYNGKSYDQPLLETRFLMARRKPPFARLAHLDLLFGARRIWKLRLERCRLVDLENEILGVIREGDLPGEMIPYVYFEYLRSRQARHLVPIFHHNAMDILTLACLTGIVPWAFRAPEEAPLSHGADWLGLARWLLNAGRQTEALCLLRKAVEMRLPDELLFRALWDIATLEKRMGHYDAAVAALNDLATPQNPYRVQALEELAKHYEHRERNYEMALECTRNALRLKESEPLLRRAARLKERLSRPQAQRLHI